MKSTSTYTFGLLKQNIYKALGEYSLNGKTTSVSQGLTADIERKFTSTLNMCARRIALGMPALEKTTELLFEGENEKSALLPNDFGEFISLELEGQHFAENSLYFSDNSIAMLKSHSSSDTGTLKYKAKINTFTPETPDNERINLTDICCDALVYLTASELCPPEYAELYSKLIYKYRDILSNYYNENPMKENRNSFYHAGEKLIKRR